MIEKNEMPKRKPMLSKFKIIGILILAVVAGLGVVFHKDAQFGLDGTVGFYAFLGLGSSVVFVLLNHFLLGPILKRKETYYDD